VAGIYTVTVTDDNNCTSTASVTIDEPMALDIATIVTPATLCDGDLLVLTDPVINGSSNIITQGWLLDDVAFASGTSVTVADNGKTLKYVVKSDCGIFESNSVMLTVQSCNDLDLTMQLSGDVCSEDNITITLKVVNNAIPALAIEVVYSLPNELSFITASSDNGSTYANGVWELGDLPTGASAQLIITAKAVGSGSNILNRAYISSINSDTYPDYISAPANMKDEKMLGINPKPNFTIETILPDCSIGSLGTITLIKNPSDSYYIDGIYNGSLTNLSLGAHTILVVTPEGCKSDIETVVLTSSLEGPQVRNYEACPIEGTSSLETLVMSYAGVLSWYADEHATASLTVAEFDMNIPGNTTYWVSQSIGGCESQRAPVVVSIKSIEFSLTESKIICLGQSVNLSVKNRPAGTTVSWNTSSSIVQQEDSIIQVRPNVSETFVATVSNEFCSTSKEVTVNVEDMNVIVPEIVTICSGAYTELFASGGDTYQWAPSFGLSDPTIANPSVSVTTTTHYLVTISKGECTTTRPVTVKVAESPKIESISERMNGELNIRVSGGISPYLFSFDDYDYMTLNNFVKQELISDNLYSIYVRDSNNCIDMTEYIYDGNGIEIPKSFSPNNDGMNDFWEIAGIDKYPSATINIYDRFHKKLISYDGSAKGWDGYYLGKIMPSVDYWYIIVLPDGSKLLGHFTLINK
jgi:gliding motility-associated-like protein